jgi:ribosomal protein S18 acetylase RimI-like enzyme
VSVGLDLNVFQQRNFTCISAPTASTTSCGVAQGHRRLGIGATLCRRALSEMSARAVEVVAIGTGGDAFHAPARALYSSLGFMEFPVAAFFNEL